MPILQDLHVRLQELQHGLRKGVFDVEECRLVLGTTLRDITLMIVPTESASAAILTSTHEKRLSRQQDLSKRYGGDERIIVNAGNNDACWEYKVARATRTRSSVNFNWPIPAAADNDARRKRLLASVLAKTRDGGLVLVVENGLGDVSHRFVLRHAFLMAFFARIPLGSGNYNIGGGSQQCRQCRGFPRLAQLQQWSERLEAAADAITEEQWEHEIMHPQHARPRCACTKTSK